MPKLPSPGDFLTASVVADMLGVSHELVTLMARQGRLPAVRVGNLWRFDREALAAWLALQSLPGPGSAPIA